MAVIERDLRDVTMAPQGDAVAQRDALWHLLEACESFGGATVRALARKRFEVWDGSDVREDHEVQRSVAAELVVVLAW